MKKKLIQDKTFSYYFWLVWDCTEEEYLNWWYKKTGHKVNANDSYGKSTFWEDEERRIVGLWINRKNNVETLSHEILHIIRFWLQEFNGIDLNKETEEIYTTIHSYFMRKCLKELGLEKFIAN